MFIVCIALLLAALVQLMGTGTRPARASAAGSTYVVNSTADQQDIDQTDGQCLTISGTCTLRAAIMESNFPTGPNTITVPSGVHLLTRVGFDDSAVAGDLDISDNVTIQGAGSGATIVDGNGAVTNGKAPTVTTPRLVGGGIYRDGNSNSFTPLSLHLSDVVIEGNTAENGGGLYAASGLVESLSDIYDGHIERTGFYSNTGTAWRD